VRCADAGRFILVNPLWLMKPKNPAAVELGRKGGKAGTAAQNAARRDNGKKGGRPPKPVDAASAAPCTVRPSAGYEMPTHNVGDEPRAGNALTPKK